jgi:two-component system, LytTR family, sensor histidine kinase AlgZ
MNETSRSMPGGSGASVFVNSGRQYNPPGFPHGFRSHLWRLLVATAGTTLAFGLFFWWFVGHGKPSELGDYLLVSAIYSSVYCLLFGLSMPYLGRAIGCAHFRGKWLFFGVAVVTLAAAGGLLIVRILVAVGMFPAGDYWRAYNSNLQIVVLISLIVCFAVTAYHHLRMRLQRTELELRTQELEKERALKLASEAQLASLESRLHPHFLFNTLNSISALTQEDPVKADWMIQRLSALLRFSLDANSRRFVPLEQELKIVTDYLEIEKVRLGERLSYSVAIPPELQALEVPPLSLVTLVENSVKHAIAPRRAGGEIRLSAHTGGEERLILEVWDSGPGFALEDVAAGHGLDILQGRLLTLFGDAAGLLVETRERGCAALIYLPQIRGAAVTHS